MYFSEKVINAEMFLVGWFLHGTLASSNDLLICEVPRGGTSAGIERFVMLVFALCLQAQGRLLVSYLICSALCLVSCHALISELSCDFTSLFLVFAYVIDKLLLATFLQNHSFNSKFLGYKNK